jgi:hypothetical protein
MSRLLTVSGPDLSGFTRFTLSLLLKPYSEDTFNLVRRAMVTREGRSMNAIEATFKNGQIVPDGPTDWPEGCRLRVEPVAREPVSETSDNDEPETAEQIAEWLLWYHSLEPLEFTPQEKADLAAWRQKMKEYDITKSQQRIEGLFQ